MKDKRSPSALCQVLLSLMGTSPLHTITAHPYGNHCYNLHWKSHFCYQRPFPQKWLFPSIVIKPFHKIHLYTNRLNHIRVWTQSLPLMFWTSTWFTFDPGHLISRTFLSMAWELAGTLAIPNRQEGILIWSLIAWTQPRWCALRDPTVFQKLVTILVKIQWHGLRTEK